MSGSTRRQSHLHVAANADIGAAPDDVYRLIADYESGHPRILPPRFFTKLRVEKGGYGAGTEITFDMLAFGRTRQARARVTEPEPGRILVETYPETGAVTTFGVNPLGAHSSRVTISTALPVRSGLLGAIERALIGRFLRRAYRAELALMEREVRRSRVTRTQNTVIMPPQAPFSRQR